MDSLPQKSRMSGRTIRPATIAAGSPTRFAAVAAPPARNRRTAPTRTTTATMTPAISA